MQDQVKLYKHFVDQVSKMGRIKRAWFTTFNLDISFFEKYILSALMGVSCQELKSPYDFEALSTNLANEEASLVEGKIEVKIFYDYRALTTSGKPKQTSVQLHPIDIKQLSNLNPNIKFNDGVFHPKIILIETYTGEYWLMVSSANLTFGGWSRNRECFFCEKIGNTRVARDVGAFLIGITKSIRGFENNSLIAKLTAGKFEQVGSKWRFFSSFNSDNFLDQLNSSKNRVPLRVWSPYYAGDLAKVIEEVHETYFETVEVIPAKNENQKIRIIKEEYELCLLNKYVSFKQDILPIVAQGAFVHAKVWLTPTTLAIGSWNMTRSGMNISRIANNNVEAGIMYDLSTKEYNDILVDCNVSTLKSPDYFKEAELEKEKEDILEKYTLTVDLVADWDKMVLCLHNPTYARLGLGENTVIKLPGFGKRRINILHDKIDFREYSKIFLTDRFFEIEDEMGIILYKGYIREVGLASRPINSFENIDDYLKGWVLERPEEKNELHKLAYKVEEDNGDELSARTREILMSNDQNAWFTSFHAFECIINRINRTNDKNIFPYKKDREMELKRIGRVLPGSLSELRMHLDNLLGVYKENLTNKESSTRFLKSPIYLWFLIEKANSVFNHFNKKIDIKLENINPIKNLKLNELLSAKDIESIGKDNFEKWKNYVVGKLRDIA
jgi:hypothetical protein